MAKSAVSVDEFLANVNPPSFCYGGDDRVTFRFPTKGGVRLIFHRGAKAKATTGFSFADPSGLIEWAAVDRTFNDVLAASLITMGAAAVTVVWPGYTFHHATETLIGLLIHQQSREFALPGGELQR